ncbi:MAG: FGGY-family carbohydrate kinase [Candidatus Limnocylindria bacterium]
MSADLVVALDVGTQSVRACVVGPDGRFLASARVPIVPYVAPRPGWAEQDPDVHWAALVEATRRVLADPTVRVDALAGVALTTQRGTVVVTDADGRPLRPAMIWLDDRRTEGLPPLGGVRGLTALGFRVLGLRDTIEGFAAACEANWLRAHEPDTWRSIRHYLLLSGYLHHRLTGRFVDAMAAQVGYLPFDYRRGAWSKPGHWSWTVAPLDPDWLPTLVEPTGRIGEVSHAAAAATGLPIGLPIIAAAADKACEVLGSGAIDPAVAAVSFGTAATVNVTMDRYVEAIPLIPPFPAALPGAWSLEVQVYRGFWMVEWFKREFAGLEVARAATDGVPVETLLDELVASVPAGSLGLTLQPYWSPGVRIPGPEAKGAIIGFGDVHTRAHVYRALLEGLAYALRDGLDRIAARTKTTPRSLRIAGGGAQSPAAIQLAADVFGLPVERTHTHEASALGAAIDAAVGLGIHTDVPSAVAAMVHVGEVREPDLAVHARYDDLYRSVYRPMYDRLRPLYREIRRITGYPPS